MASVTTQQKTSGKTIHPVFNDDESIVVEYAGMCGSTKDWITLVPQGTPEDDWSRAHWSYLDDPVDGQLTFASLPPGNYEARAYCDWPQGGFEVKARSNFSVLQKLDSLAQLDLSATNVQFRNKAFGKYVVFKWDPRGGGVLEGGDAMEPSKWSFYQADGNPDEGNVEIKSKRLEWANWNAYNSYIAWNHAKRLPNTTAPDAPHAWTIENAGAGEFRIRLNHNNEYLEMVNMLHYLGTGPKVMTCPEKNDNAQLWEIFVDKKK